MEMKCTNNEQKHFLTESGNTAVPLHFLSSATCLEFRGHVIIHCMLLYTYYTNSIKMHKNNLILVIKTM